MPEWGIGGYLGEDFFAIAGKFCSGSINLSRIIDVNKYGLLLLWTLFFGPEITAAQPELQKVIENPAVHGWPNERTSDNVPSNANDGDTLSFTWTTEAFNTATGHIGLDFDSLRTVTRVRLWKDPEAGNSGRTSLPKNLVVRYTTDSGPMSMRGWTHVTGLVNGFNGQEMMVADSVLSEGIVWGDFHDSVDNGDGWASLTFDPVEATGMAIEFSKTEGTTYSFVHYKVHEFLAYAPSGLPISVNREEKGIFELYPGFPNPFTSQTTISYTLHASSHVSVKIFNLLGQEIETLVDEIQPIGKQRVSWSGSTLESGVYFVQLQGGDQLSTSKLVKLR